METLKRKNKMTKVELKETLNGYGFRTIEGMRTYYSKAVIGEDGTIRLRVGEWYVVMGNTDTGYKVASMSKIPKN
jgi:mRNA-degrading endonuclease RelE of RelBE toxin-antitoxin system